MLYAFMLFGTTATGLGIVIGLAASLALQMKRWG